MPEKKEKVPVKAKPAKAELMLRSPAEYLGEMDQMFKDFTRGFENTLSQIAAGWQWPRTHLLELPAARQALSDLIDAGTEYQVRAEVPGIPKENLNVTVTPRGIEIEGEAKATMEEEKKGFIHRERGYTKVYKGLAFPEEVIPEKAEAMLKDGVLEVKIPKKTPTEVKKRRIEVK